MEGFQYGDIIVIGAIAAFIILRYRAMLGGQTGRDPGDIQRPKPLEEYERVVKLAEREPKKAAVIEPKQEDSKYPDKLALSLKNMRNVDPDFSADEFLHGARAAFEMIIKAFNDRDHDTLKMLLDQDTYESFRDVIATQEAQNVKHVTTLVAIQKAEIKHATLSGKKARITVEFVSDQIHLVRDANGNITQGNPSDVDTIADEWVFERDLNSSSPNWLIIET